MISLDQFKRIDPDLKNLPEEDIERIRIKLYEIGQFAFDEWIKEQNKPKPVQRYPVGFMHSLSGSCRM
jgi:hypothetical protein